MRSTAPEKPTQPDGEAHERRLQDEAAEQTRVKPNGVANGLSGSPLTREERLELGVAVMMPAERAGGVEHSPTVAMPAPSRFSVLDGGVREAFVEGLIA